MEGERRGEGEEGGGGLEVGHYTSGTILNHVWGLAVKHVIDLAFRGGGEVDACGFFVSTILVFCLKKLNRK